MGSSRTRSTPRKSSGEKAKTPKSNVVEGERKQKRRKRNRSTKEQDSAPQTETPNSKPVSTKRTSKAKMTANVVAASKRLRNGDQTSSQKTQIHRCRFVTWVPDAVHILAANQAGNYLAVGRAGSDIEVWELSDGWHLVGVVPGPVSQSDAIKLDAKRLNADLDAKDQVDEDDDTSVAAFALRALVWQGDRLFGATIDGSVFQVDLNRMSRGKSIETSGGPVWALDVSPSGDTLAAGCDDGRVRLYDISGNKFDFVKTLTARIAGRVLCLKYGPSNDSVLFTSDSEGGVRKWDVSTGRPIVSVEVERFGGQDLAMVWSLAVLDESTLVSGDSFGRVTFWDMVSGTILHAFQETADVFALAVSKDRSKVFASGIDSRVGMYVYKPATQAWSTGTGYRPHTHDVRALSIVSLRMHGSDETEETLVSGGEDTQLCWYSVPRFGKGSCRPSKVTPFRTKGLVSVSDIMEPREETQNLDARHMLVQHQRYLQLYRMLKGTRPDEIEYQSLKVIRGGHGSVRCSSLSQDGRWVACGDDSGLAILYLDTDPSREPLRALRLPSKVVSKHGAPLQVVFTINDTSTFLVAAFQSGTVLIFLCDPEVTGFPEVVVEYETSSKLVVSLAVSPNGQHIVTGAVNGDLVVHQFSEDDAGDTQYTIPSAVFGGKAHSCIEFHPTAAGTLVVVTVDNKFHMYDVAAQRLSDWSAHNTDLIPSTLVNSPQSVVAVAIDPDQPRKMICATPSCMLLVDFDGSVVQRASATACSVRVIKDFQPLMAVKYLAGHELLVLEANWLKVMNLFPDVVYRRRYGAE